MSMKDQIRSKIEAGLTPTSLDVVDDSQPEQLTHASRYVPDVHPRTDLEQPSGELPAQLLRRDGRADDHLPLYEDWILRRRV